MKLEQKYEWRPEMGEISGFGGGYEDMCRKMVIAGVEFLDSRPGAKPCFRTYSGIYGVIVPKGEEAEKLEAAMLAVTGGDCTGAMMQATVSAVLYIRKNGWEKYCEEMSKPDRRK